MKHFLLSGIVAFALLSLTGCTEAPPERSGNVSSPDPVVQMQGQIDDVDTQIAAFYTHAPSDRRDWKESETEAISTLSKRRDTLREQQTRLIVLLSKKDAQGKPVELDNTQELLRKMQEDTQVPSPAPSASPKPLAR